MYIIINNNKITRIYSGQKLDNSIEVPLNFTGVIGQDIREFDDQLNLRPLSERVKDGLFIVPKNQKLVGEELIVKTEIELMKDGLSEIPKGFLIVGEELVEKDLEKKLQDGDITKNEYAEIKIAEQEGYLYSTDWYVSRFTETGIVIPIEVKQKRAEARTLINKYREGL